MNKNHSKEAKNKAPKPTSIQYYIAEPNEYPLSKKPDYSLDPKTNALEEGVKKINLIREWQSGMKNAFGAAWKKISRNGSRVGFFNPPGVQTA